MADSRLSSRETSQAKEYPRAVGYRSEKFFRTEGHLFDLLDRGCCAGLKRWSPNPSRPGRLYARARQGAATKAARSSHSRRHASVVTGSGLAPIAIARSAHRPGKSWSITSTEGQVRRLACSPQDSQKIAKHSRAKPNAESDSLTGPAAVARRQADQSTKTALEQGPRRSFWEEGRARGVDRGWSG